MVTVEDGLAGRAMFRELGAAVERGLGTAAGVVRVLLEAVGAFQGALAASFFAFCE
ncbi:hypothetical protein GCM10009603_49940 [Nocardiopsis exhalans]